MKILKFLPCIAIFSLLTGCATSVNEAQLNNTMEAKDASLVEKYGDKYSIPMQMMYLYTQEKPFEENNLDQFNFSKDYYMATKASMAGAVGLGLAANSSWQMILLDVATTAASGTPLNFDYRTNRFIFFEPVVGSVEDTRKSAQRKMTKIVEDAYIDAGYSTRVFQETDHLYGELNVMLADSVIESKGGYSVIPTGAKECDLPKMMEGYPFYTLKGNNQINFDVCITMLPTYGLLIRNNNGEFPFAPKGDFIMFMHWFPTTFPINNIKTDEKYAYLYQPSFTWLQEHSNWFKAQSEATAKSMYKDELVTYNPYIKKLSTGEFMYFNPNVAARQESPTVRALEEKPKEVPEDVAEKMISESNINAEQKN